MRKLPPDKVNPTTVLVVLVVAVVAVVVTLWTQPRPEPATTQSHLNGNTARLAY